MTSPKTFVRKIVNPPDGPPRIAPYSPAVIVDNVMYLAGSIGMDPQTGNLVAGGIAAETEQALKNMGTILRAAGIDYNNVVKTTVYLSDINNWPAMNVVYEKFFKIHPARAAFAVKDLPKGALVEIEAVAIVGKIVDQE